MSEKADGVPDRPRFHDGLLEGRVSLCSVMGVDALPRDDEHDLALAVGIHGFRDRKSPVVGSPAIHYGGHGLHKLVVF